MNEANEAPTIEYVAPPERTEPVTEPIVTEKQEQPKLNRAERRRFTRTATRKARREARKATQRQSLAIRELRGRRCQRCNLLYIGRTRWRCQCKAVPARHEDLARQLQAMQESEQASASEAQRRLYEQREYDDEQHRLAKENGANATA